MYTITIFRPANTKPLTEACVYLIALDLTSRRKTSGTSVILISSSLGYDLKTNSSGEFTTEVIEQTIVCNAAKGSSPDSKS